MTQGKKRKRKRKRKRERLDRRRTDTGCKSQDRGRIRSMVGVMKFALASFGEEVLQTVSSCHLHSHHHDHHKVMFHGCDAGDRKAVATYPRTDWICSRVYLTLSLMLPEAEEFAGKERYSAPIHLKHHERWPAAAKSPARPHEETIPQEHGRVKSYSGLPLASKQRPHVSSRKPSPRRRQAQPQAVSHRPRRARDID